MVLLTTLQIPTCDNTAITFDTLNFTCDGADLINGGGTSIPHKPGIQGGLAYQSDVPIFVQYQSGRPLGNGPSKPFVPFTIFWLLESGNGYWQLESSAGDWLLQGAYP